MTLAELVANESARRLAFPVCERKAFLAHAGVSPLPQCVVDAMQRYLDTAARDNQEDVIREHLVAETRALAARLIEAEPDEIAFVGSTSMGLALVAAGLDWQPGDNVVCYRDDYPANVYPWMALAARGVAVRFVEPAHYGRITVSDLERVLDARTRLVALASAHYVSGWRLPIAEIGQLLKARGVLFCLDGIQTMGALRSSCRAVDFAAADAHKWLLGPLGAALLFVRREHFDRLRPSLVGWASAPCPGFIAQDQLQFWSTARRYECGSLNLAGIVGLRAALELILGWGIEAVETRVLDLAEQVVRRAHDRGHTVLGPTAREQMTGIVSLTDPGADWPATHARLTARGLPHRSVSGGRHALPAGFGARVQYGSGN